MKIKGLIRAVKALWFRKYYVVLDGRANSVTISRSLYRHIMRGERSNTAVVVFKCRDTGLYAFAMREDFPFLLQSKSYFPSLQYNEEHMKIGFRSEYPSVTAICADYGCPMCQMVRLSCLPRHTAKGETFYEIQRP